MDDPWWASTVRASRAGAHGRGTTARRDHPAAGQPRRIAGPSAAHLSAALRDGDPAHRAGRPARRRRAGCLPTRRPSPRGDARRLPGCDRGRSGPRRGRTGGQRRRRRPCGAPLATGREPDRIGLVVRRGAPAVPRRDRRPGPSPVPRSGPPRDPVREAPRCCWIACCCDSSRSTSAAIEATEHHGPRRPPADPHLAPGPHLQRGPAGPVAGAATWLPADLGHRDAVLRHRRRRRGHRQRIGLERGAVPDLVPDRRGLDRRLAGPGDGVPAGPDAVRVHVRVPAALLGGDRDDAAQQPDLRGQRTPAVPVPHGRGGAGPGHRRRDVLPEPELAATRRRRPHRHDHRLGRADGGDHAAGPGLRGGSGDPPADGDDHPGLPAAARPR